MFGAKRKARKIQVSEENEEPTAAAAPASAPDEPMNDAPSTADSSPSTVKFTRRPAKSSSLRKSININDDQDGAADADDDESRPAVIRPNVSRSSSTKLKKKAAASSRLSFGATEDTGDTPEPSQPFTPKKNPSAASLTQRATENSAIRAPSASSRTLPTRSFGVEQDRPSYSKEYLDELQSSTPNTPQNIENFRIQDDEGEPMSIDAAELEGAVFVPSADLPVSTTGGTGAAHILSATEIREKKERRTRLAKEGDAYKSDEDEDDGYISLLPKKKKDETRLIAEDEDLGEGYDEFVEDGRLELGRRGEREARSRHRREMEELINAAEGASEDGDDSDSDMERKAAYEAAQTRAAMDGLHRLADEEDGAGGGGFGVGRMVIPKMKPLPELGESLARMRALVTEMEEQVAAKRKRIQDTEREKEEILGREKEVQDVLNQAGTKYQSAMGVKSEHVVDPETLAAQSPLRPGAGPGVQIPSGERGLESFGTPTRKADDVGDAMEE